MRAAAAAPQQQAAAACPCPVCGACNRSLLCQNCVSGQILQAASLDTLRQRKATLQQQLEARLQAREAGQQQQLSRWHQQRSLAAAQARAQRAQHALAQAQQQLDALAAHNASRRRVLEQVRAQAGAVRAEVLGNKLPTILRYQALTAAHVGAMLRREQRLRLRQLTEVLPLRINAVRTSGGPCQITVANLRLPQSGSAPPAGWPDPEAMSAALGYLLLLVERVGLIMGGPMLHEALYQGSTSSVWQPPGFWSRQPRSPAAMLPLHVLGGAGSAGGGGGGGAGSSQAAYATTSNRYLATATFWGLPRADSGGLVVVPASIASGAAAAASSAASAAAAAFTRATGLEAPNFYGTAAGASGPSSSSNPHEPGEGGDGSRAGSSDFKAAWDLLQRSLACFLRDKAASNGMQLPAAWNPLAWLVVYCAVVKRDARQDGKLVALSSRVDAAAAAAATGAGSSGGGELAAAAAAAAAAGREDAGGDGLPSDSSLGSMLVGGPASAAAALPGAPAWQQECEEEEEDDGWVVQATFLPPPPSQPDKVEHWARAMFADGNALASAVASGAVGGGGGLGLAAGLVGLQRGQQQQLQPGGAGGSAALLGSSPGGGMMSMERVRQLFSK